MQGRTEEIYLAKPRLIRFQYVKTHFLVHRWYERSNHVQNRRKFYGVPKYIYRSHLLVSIDHISNWGWRSPKCQLMYHNLYIRFIIKLSHYYATIWRKLLGIDRHHPMWSVYIFSDHFKISSNSELVWPSRFPINQK